MRILIPMLLSAGCARNDNPGAMEVDPVPTGEPVPTVEPQEYDCWSETLIDDLLLPGSVNQRKYRGWDDRGPELLRAYELADLDGDTRWDREEQWEYSEAGLRLRYERTLDDRTTKTWT
ncbi:MAG: hypothetical protein AAF211_14955, partial [Myxococcota bacterium]